MTALCTDAGYVHLGVGEVTGHGGPQRALLCRSRTALALRLAVAAALAIRPFGSSATIYRVSPKGYSPMLRARGQEGKRTGGQEDKRARVATACLLGESAVVVDSYTLYTRINVSMRLRNPF